MSFRLLQLWGDEAEDGWRNWGSTNNIVFKGSVFCDSVELGDAI